MNPIRSSLALAIAAQLLPSIAGAQIYQAEELIDGTGDGVWLLREPQGIAVAPSGNVYVAGRISDNVFEITPQGVITRILDFTGDGQGHLMREPRELAVDAAGTLYIAADDSNNVLRRTAAGVVTEIIGPLGDGAGNILDDSNGIAVDAAGNVYVTGYSSNNAFKVTPGGSITEIIDAAGDGSGNVLSGAIDVALDAAGNVYVVGRFSNNAFRITPGGAITQIIDASGDGLGNPLSGASCLAVGPSGNVYVGARFSNNVFRVTPAGSITEILDSSGDGAGHAFGFGNAIGVDSMENVYVLGSTTDNAFRITPSGSVVQVVDYTQPLGPGVFSAGSGVAIDASDRAYFCAAGSENAVGLLTDFPPVFDAGSPCGQVLTAYVGVPVSFDVTVSDEGGVLLALPSPLPPNATLTPLLSYGNPATSTLTWTPSAGDLGTHTFEFIANDSFGQSVSCSVTIEVVPECFLLLGQGPGSDVVVGGGATFTTQLSGVDELYAVTMDDIPELTIASVGRRAAVQMATPFGAPFLPAGSPGGVGRAHTPVVPGRLYFAQVVMWNPYVFPTNPAQWSRGLAVYVMPSMELVSIPFGGKNGIEIRALLTQDANGDDVLKFPFTIDGL